MLGDFFQVSRIIFRYKFYLSFTEETENEKSNLQDSHRTILASAHVEKGYLESTEYNYNSQLSRYKCKALLDATVV